MKYLLLLLFTTQAFATDLVFVNNTKFNIRIDNLHNRCIGTIINPENPTKLKPGQRYTLSNTQAVAHTYSVCGDGMCASSVVGMKDAPVYTVSVNLKDKWINGDATPDHWIGNLECK